MASTHREVIVYSDGSGLNEQIGAAVVLYKDGTEQGVLGKHLGSEEQHTIFEAKVLGLSLVAKLIKTKVDFLMLTITTKLDSTWVSHS